MKPNRMRPFPCGDSVDGGPWLFAFPGFGFAFLYACLIHIFILYWLQTGSPGDCIWFRSALGTWSVADVVRVVNWLTIGYLLTLVPQISFSRARKKAFCWCFLLASIVLILGTELYAARAAWLSVQPFVGMDSSTPQP